MALHLQIFTNRAKAVTSRSGVLYVDGMQEEDLGVPTALEGAAGEGQGLAQQGGLGLPLRSPQSLPPAPSLGPQAWPAPLGQVQIWPRPRLIQGLDCPAPSGSLH